jgi:acetyl-CoA synthetase
MEAIMSNPQDSVGTSTTIDALLQEERVFAPSAAFVAQATIADPTVYERAAADPDAFWAEAARRLDWFTPFTSVLDWDPTATPPTARWFADGTLNAAYNCVDRHLKTFRKNKAALIWEGEPGDRRVLTYQDLYREVNTFAAVLQQLGVQAGDRVAFYMPMLPELAIGLLACARLGAPHTVIFGGFSAEALRDRIQDSAASVVVTADGGWRRGNVVPLKDTTDAALTDTPSVRHVLVVQRVGPAARAVAMHEGRDVWYHDAVAQVTQGGRHVPVVAPVPVASEHPLYIMYTSGTTGKPKGQLHTTGGYLTGVALTHQWIFDLKEEDVYWCTADIGWVTGHSYIVYGPLANGASVVMYEGAPDYPDKDRFWALVEQYRVSILYTAPTSIRTFMRWGEQYPAAHDLTSLRLLGTVGEPINPEAWIWYQQHIGGGAQATAAAQTGRPPCPIVDTWWQTETGMILISPLPGLVPTKPGSATRAFPGVFPAILDAAGAPVPAGSGAGGNLVLTRPWPAMSRGIWGDPARYQATYWATYPGQYLTGDGARQDADGYYWLLGRVDDVVNVSGHRLGTMEVESALVAHPAVAEAAVIGASDALTGQAIVAFVTPRAGQQPNDALTAELKEQVVRSIGALARPQRIYYTSELPKTRSAKIMRRLLRDIAEGRVLGDTTTLLDPSIVAQIKEQYEASEG